jgi:hypothetical protein
VAVNKPEAHLYLDSLPDDAEVIVLLPREMAKRRIEKDGIVSIRVPESTKLLFWNILDRVAARIGNQRRADALDYILSEMNEVLNHAEEGQAQ